MQAGETMRARDGHQVALFPLDYMYCTQVSSPSSFSHCCGTATDWVGPTTVYPYYAPFDCHLIYSSTDTRAYLSDDKVWTPTGLQYVSIGFTHDSNPPTQTSFRQGELIGHTGVQGFVTGDHVHIVCSTAQYWSYINSGITCQAGNTCYYIDGNEYIYDMLFVTGKETVVELQGMEFIEFDGQLFKEKGMPLWMKYMTATRYKGKGNW